MTGARPPLTPAATLARRRRALRRMARGASGALALGWAAALGLAPAAQAQTSQTGPMGQTPPVGPLPTSPARSLLVVAHPDFPARSVGRGELSALYLRTRRTLADGTPVQVHDAQDPALREAFQLALLGRSPVQMHAYWSRMVFSGAGRPPPQLDTAALLAQLRADSTALGYLPAGADLRGLRVLLTLELP
jgi:hypothetical protein